MPGPISPLPPLSEAVTQEAVEATEAAYPSDEVKKALSDIASDLLAIEQQTTILGPPGSDSYHPSLRTLYTRLEAGHLAPSPLQAHANEEERWRSVMHKRTGKTPLNRPLEDFEDLYYAMLARIQDMHQSLTTRLTNGFNSPSTPLIPGQADLTISSFHAWLFEQWTILNSPSFAKALDAAIRRSRVKHLHQELLAQLQTGELTQADADELLADLYDPEEYDGVQGLSWIAGWSPAMIAGWLEEKYRIVFRVEKEEARKRERWSRKRKGIQKVAKAQKGREDKEVERVNKEQEEMRQEIERLEAERQQHEMLQRRQYDMALEAQRQEEERQRQEREQHSAEWQMRKARVSQYSQFLRGMASDDARRLVDETHYNVQQSFYNADTIQEQEHEDVSMKMDEF